MDKLVNSIINNLKIDALTFDEAHQAIFYIDYLIKNEADYNEVIRLIKIKNDVSKRINNLNNETLKNINKIGS